MKQVLILTDQYTPFFAPRMAAVAKYLPQYGWQPTVITGIATNTNTNHHHATDDGRGDCCTVYRLPLENHTTKCGHYVSFLAELFWEARDKNFEHAILDLCLPKPDAILCFAYRKFPLRAAAQLAKHWHIPFVADCRDIVEQYPIGGFLPQKITLCGRPLNGLMGMMQRRITNVRNRYLRQAASVITVSPWHRQVLEATNPDTYLIYNGYDPELFVPMHPKTDHFSIVYAGRLVSLDARDPSLLFDALTGPRLRHIINQGKLRVDWYVDDYSHKLLEPIVARYGLKSINHYHQMVPLSTLSEHLSQASILLQLAAPEQEIGAHSYVTTKIFESMAMRKPILVVRSDEAILADICLQSGMGCLAKSVTDIEDHIIAQYERWLVDGFTTEEPKDATFVESFSRYRQTASFACILDQATWSDPINIPSV